MKRIYHHYEKWECYKNGMWSSPTKENYQSNIDKAIKFMSDTDMFKQGMENVINNWEYSCEHHLSDVSSNRNSFLGQAAGCISIGVNETIIRNAWVLLSDECRIKANKAAANSIRKWEQKRNLIKQLSLF
jgi:hypothetical protein